VAAQRTTFEKLQRDRAKKAKAAMKRERRQSGEPGPVRDLGPDLPREGEELSAAALLELIERIHAQLDAKEISFEEFEEKKAELLARLPID
jgi:SMC interacting uncharacterized protein involved in chromosome segregation